MFVDQLGTIVKAMGIINGFFVGPLLSVFLLGFLTRRANSFGAFGGMIAGTALTAVVASMPVHWLPAALQELVEFGAVRRKVRSIRLNVKNEKTDGYGQRRARAQYCPVPSGDIEYHKYADDGRH